ncbi:immunoglobulin superfamily member 23 isoform X2 [Nycticebus coucang]|uniref:immunoglobulin superfamily member 23 isoform X2 n=1 Tax=Nycticebus coucang TaxID=9470 RepID=UPI00234DEF9B|nr:immunoglobulin superfamily member 23 isoform X2 [Nycticebus coucang]
MTRRLVRSPWTERGMGCPLHAGTSHSPAWKKLLVTGILLTSCTCSDSSELPFSVQLDSLTEGARVHLPVPGSLDGILSTSWFRGHEAQPAAMIFSPEGLPGPAHTGREMLGTHGSLVIRNVTAQDSGSYTVVLETSSGRRSATEQIHVKNSFKTVPLLTFPETIQGIIQSDLNYSVILEWVTTMNPEPMQTWTLNGKICGTGEKLFIRRLSWEQLGTYMCTATNSQGQLSSQPVTVSLPQAIVDPTEAEPMEPDPSLSLSGGSAIGLLVAGILGAMALIGGVGFTIIHSQR